MRFFIVISLRSGLRLLAKKASGYFPFQSSDFKKVSKRHSTSSVEETKNIESS